MIYCVEGPCLMATESHSEFATDPQRNINRLLHQRSERLFSAEKNASTAQLQTLLFISTGALQPRLKVQTESTLSVYSKFLSAFISTFQSSLLILSHRQWKDTDPIVTFRANDPHKHADAISAHSEPLSLLKLNRIE